MEQFKCDHTTGQFCNRISPDVAEEILVLDKEYDVRRKVLTLYGILENRFGRVVRTYAYEIKNWYKDRLQDGEHFEGLLWEAVTGKDLADIDDMAPWSYMAEGEEEY